MKLGGVTIGGTINRFFIKLFYTSDMQTVKECRNVLNNFMKNRLIGKSNYLRLVLLKGQTSRPHSKIGRHLVLMSSKITSSDAILPILPKIPFTARWKERLKWTWSSEHLNVRDWTIKNQGISFHQPMELNDHSKYTNFYNVYHSVVIHVSNRISLN